MDFRKESEVTPTGPSLTPNVDAALAEMKERKRDDRASRVEQFLADNPGAPSKEYYDYDKMIQDGKAPEATDSLSFLPQDYYKSSRRPFNRAWEYDVSSKAYQLGNASDRIFVKTGRNIVQGAFETMIHGPWTWPNAVGRAGAEYAGLKLMDVWNDLSSDDQAKLEKGDEGIWETVRDDMFDRYDNPPELPEMTRLENPETTQGMMEDIGVEILTLLGDIGVANKILRVTKLDATKARNFAQRQWDFLKQERGVALGEMMWSKTGTAGNLSTMLADMGIGGEITEYLDSTNVDNETETAIKNVIEGVVMSKFLQLGWVAGKQGVPALYDYMRNYDPKLANAPMTQKGMAAFHVPEGARGTQTLARQDFIYGDAPGAPARSRGVNDIYSELQDEATEAWGGRAEYTDENIPTIAGNMADEAAAVVERNPTAVGWYKANLDEAMDHASTLHPELKADPQAETAFKFIKAITSNGMRVKDNAIATNRLYSEFKKTGQFPIDGAGEKIGTMKKTFQQANEVLDKHGFDYFQDFLNKDFTVRELKAAGFNVSGENMDTVLKGSAVFGPKVGGGFFQNLSGNYAPATFDLWWQRTWGRHTGTLKASAEQLSKAGQRARTALTGPAASKLAKQHGYSLRELKKAGNESMLAEFAGKVKRAHDRDFLKTRRVKNDLEKAAVNYLKMAVDHVKAPRSGSERAYMRRVFTAIQDNLKQRGIDMDIADIQAVMWYAEKDLSAKMGGEATAAGSDYASAWKQLADEHSGGRGSGNTSGSDDAGRVREKRSDADGGLQ